MALAVAACSCSWAERVERLDERRAVGSNGVLVLAASSPSPWLELGFCDMVDEVARFDRRRGLLCSFFLCVENLEGRTLALHSQGM